ncbi:hypothetical protein [Akkermansia muciniphila]|uniref:hypothetical protein n=1 Tax=Akkermansia muciniphila TaxID=239935 RepID=UPI001C52B3F1|nr:hypothetical protein [Akkermansia muciniphila]
MFEEKGLPAFGSRFSAADYIPVHVGFLSIVVKTGKTALSWLETDDHGKVPILLKGFP